MRAVTCAREGALELVSSASAKAAEGALRGVTVHATAVFRSCRLAVQTPPDRASGRSLYRQLS